MVKMAAPKNITHSYANIKPSKTSTLPTPRQIANFTFDINLQIIHVILSNGSKSICVVRHRLRLVDICDIRFTTKSQLRRENTTDTIL